MKILLVEDEEMLSAFIAKGFRKLGYAVDTVFDGEEALYNYGVYEYDLYFARFAFRMILQGFFISRFCHRNIFLTDPADSLTTDSCARYCI